MKKKIVIITSNHLRHKFFRNSVDKFINSKVVLCIEEKSEQIPKNSKKSNLQKKHFKERRHYEKKFFRKYFNCKMNTKKVLKVSKNQINYDKKILNKIKKYKPNLILTYGCSILKKEVIREFKNKIINIPLGLSPYYRGSGTNYWPFVKNELQFVGVTFMLIDEGIDTGPILHQCRAELYKSDNVHMVGNRLIKNLVKILEKIINNFEKITAVKQWKYKYEKVFKEKDFNDNSLNKLFSNYNKGIVVKYLKQKKNIDKKFPVIENNIL